MKRCVIVKAVAAISAMILTPAVADSVFWHFNGKDGDLAPATLTDTSGTYSMKRYQVKDDSDNGKTYASQLTQDDCAGVMACWVTDGALVADTAVSGSIQMYKESTSGKYRGSGYYYLNSEMTKAILSTNSVGEILPFTVELIFKLAPFDETVEKKNVHLFTLVRGSNSGSTGGAVLDVNVNSTGGLYVMCQSRTGSNGDLCKWWVKGVDETRYRDGKWHHLAVVYNLDTSKSPHQGSLELFFDYQSQGTQELLSKKENKGGTGMTVLEYAAWYGEEATEKSMMDGLFVVGDGSSKCSCSAVYCVDELRISNGALGSSDFMRMLPERNPGFFFPMGDAGNLTMNLVSGISAKATAVTENKLTRANLLDGGGVGRLCSVGAAFSEGSSFAVDKIDVYTLWANPVTLEFSFKTEEQGLQTLVSQGSEWRIALDNGVLKWNHGDTSETIASGLSDGKWHSVAMAYEPGADNAAYSFFVDGHLCREGEGALLPVGANADIVAGSHFAGQMAGLRGTPAALPAEKLLSVKEQPYIAWWPFTSVDPVGTGLASVPSADGNSLHELDAVLKKVDESYRPSVSDDVPCRSVWRPRSAKVLNPDNRTSLFFRNNGGKKDDGKWYNGDGGGYLKSRHSLGNFGSSYTIEFFVKPMHTYEDFVTGLLTAALDDARYMFVYAWHSLKVSVQFSASVSAGYGTTELTPGEWHHVAVTVDSDSDPGNMTISTYVDYNAAASYTTNWPFGTASSYSIALSGEMGRCLEGFMDEIVITPGIVPADDFMRAFDPGESSHKIWLMDGVSGNEHYDGGESPCLTGGFSGKGAVASSELPKSPLQFRVAGKGKVNPVQSVLFDGKGGLHIPCAAVAGADDFTVEATVKGVGAVASKRRSGGVSWSFGIGDDGIPFLKLDTGNSIMAYKTESSVSATGSCAVDVTMWHHVALVCDRVSQKKLTLYVDGEAVAFADADGMVIDDGDFVIGDGFSGHIVGAGFASAALTPDDFMMPQWRHGMTINIR